MPLVGVACVMALSNPAAAAQAQTQVHYDIPAQDLATSLRHVGQLSGTEIMFAPTDVAGIIAPLLKGDLSLHEALDRLLAGTDLEARFNNGTVIVRGRSQAAAFEKDQTAAAHIMVTGSRIRGTNPTIPVRSITRTEIDRSDFSDVGTLMRSLPEAFGGGQNPGVMGASSSVIRNQNVSNASSINLRGLGADATLVLFNGHRMSADSFFQASDISGIPMDALERVDILKDGASAIYGSDAVAGVVNFVLRKDFNGAMLKARVAGATQGGGEEQVYSALVGHATDRWHAMANVEYSDQEGVTASQRNFTSGMYGGSTILWPQKRTSVVVSSGGTLGGFDLSLDGLYAHRSSSSVNGYSPTAPVLRYAQDNRSHALALSVGRDVASGWRVEITGVTAGTKNESEGNGTHTAYKNKSEYAELVVNGTPFSLGEREVRVAVGGGARHEEFAERSLPTGVISTSGERSVDYLFGEILAPLVDNSNGFSGLEHLDLSLSARYEDYSDFGKTTNLRAGVRYVPVEGLALRATWGTSFKAPSFLQQYLQSLVYLFPAATFGSSQPGTGLMTWGGKADLKPEKSESWTAGIEYTPASIPSLSLSATYFHIDYTDRIVQPVVSYGRALTDPVYAPFLLLDPSPAVQAQYISQTDLFYNLTGAAYDPASVLVLVENRYTNAAAQIAQGVDVGYRQAVDVGASRLNLFANATWLDLSQQTSPVSAVQSLAGTLNNAPDFKARAGVSWSAGGWRATGTINYLNGSVDDVTIPHARIGSWTTADANVAYQFGKDRGWASGLKIAMSATNLFDQDPPFVLGAAQTNAGQHYDSTNTTPVGRIVTFEISKSW
ncbi:TonB-dependent receptor domain-containing protein [Hephaestia sp. GCM10023244]|uniref:TonB-dependent receptor n=1 Tax=unclassified Hephaestia TaxID=2631281 RepID=UPI002077718B|nr:TonB-dependent receptor [Hephaestia sp. MAHUQ-44]MCM8732396.1 TonB-dependent receptor [Hephaestia sp. MAHUQ-44]